MSFGNFGQIQNGRDMILVGCITTTATAAAAGTAAAAAGTGTAAGTETAAGTGTAAAILNQPYKTNLHRDVFTITTASTWQEDFFRFTNCMKIIHH